MVGGKRKKSQSDPFGKKIRAARKGKKAARNVPQLPPPPPDDDEDDTGSGSLPDVPDLKEILNGDGCKSKKTDKSKQNDIETSSPAYILIPILGEISQDEGNNEENMEISIEDAHNYPIGGGVSRKKNKSLRLPALKSPLTMKLEKAREEMDEYNKAHDYDVNKLPLRDQVLLLDTDLSVRANILKKFQDMDKAKSSYDVSKFNNWIKDVLRLPFGKSVPLPISLEDGPEKIGEYLQKVRNHLNKAIAGQDAAKEEVVDFIARIIANPKSRGNILALTGGPGVGKTRLVRRGIAEALGRPFHVINLGGMNDVHVLTGHDLTYTGAKYGRFAQILIQSQCDNPVIYLDEIDKIQSSHDKGMEIFRVLTHVLDEEQNHEFYDEYFGNVAIDLSKVLFVASLNKADDIESILRDRLKLIQVKDLDRSIKVDITRNYILPELCEQVAMPEHLLQLSDDVIRYVIAKTEEEGGCRQLKRKWETVVQKLNTKRITRTGPFAAQETVTLTESMVDDLLKTAYYDDKFPHHIYG